MPSPILPTGAYFSEMRLRGWERGEEGGLGGGQGGKGRVERVVGWTYS